MGNIVRASAVLAASVLAVPLWAVPSALAAEASEAAQYGAYFSAAGVSQQGLGLPAESPNPPPNATASTDGVSEGNLAVSGSGGQEEKVSFLSFALASVPFDATIDKAVLTVPLVPSAPPNDVTYNADPSLVRVCKAGDSGFFGEDAQALRLAPARLCDEFASEPAALSADGKAYVFDITGLASMWLEANDGLALTLAEGASTPFQVVFAPADQSQLAVSFTEAAGSEPVVDLPVDTTFDSGSVSLGGGFDGGSLSFDTGGGFGTVASPLVDTALPAAAPETATPGPSLAGAPVRRVSAMTEAPLTPSPSFWAGLALLAGAVGLLSLIMGDSRVALPATESRQSRLSKALQGRAPGTGRAARPALARPLSV